MARTYRGAILSCNLLRANAKALADVRGENGEQPASVGTTWEEAAERMKRLRAQGEPWTSQQKMAEQIGCSPATISKVIRQTPPLEAWAKPQVAAAPKAQSLNDAVTDHTSQSTELDPEDNAAIREFVEQADPETKAWFLALPSTEDQLAFLNDPDKHQRVLGRKV